MLRALTVRLLALPFVLAVAAFVLAAPHVATPAHAFEIEKQDWDSEATDPDDLPDHYGPYLDCAEAGDSECQAFISKVWAGKGDPNIWNPDESGRWAQAAAHQGHLGGMYMFSL